MKVALTGRAGIDCFVSQFKFLDFAEHTCPPYKKCTYRIGEDVMSVPGFHVSNLWCVSSS